MNLNQLRQIQPLLFSTSTVAERMKISPSSAKVACHRYVKQGILLRLKRDVYVLADRWERFGEQDVFVLANRLQVPSYVSMTTALAYYEITTQVQQSVVESVAVVRTTQVEVREKIFKYTKLKKNLYTGFIKKNGFFIATPEKAFLDGLYLMSMNRYRLDLSAIDQSKLDARLLFRNAKTFPRKTRQLLKKYGSTKSARSF